ncbi:hypothetical protein SFC79_04330 [Nocardioides sp. S-58]|uniref:Uncharacterized protein n=1 Tax=Nocardioides renjunii TaxID=3095075 RepID=A0ABU5K7Y6_9ACTN|nr:hypothetical protein [Nocardioides sp. S-58]MDZ5660982.1 hypothetical protein [Nocardioides sp. S-58]
MDEHKVNPSRGKGPQDAPDGERGREMQEKLDKGIKHAEAMRSQHGAKLDKLLEERGLTHEDLGAVLSAAASPGAVALIPPEVEEIMREAGKITGLKASKGDDDA